MSARSAPLLLVLCLPALLSATCNPKKRTRDHADTEQTAFEAGKEVDEVPPAKPATKPEPCAPALAHAPPLGPVVGPACPGSPAAAIDTVASLIDERASTLAAGLVALGPAFGGRVGEKPELAGGAVLQGPPHCYTIIALCEGGGPASILARPRAPADGGEPAPGPALTVCPDATSGFDIALSSPDGEKDCGARIYGD
jgi:hypothetical protein